MLLLVILSGAQRSRRIFCTDAAVTAKPPSRKGIQSRASRLLRSSADEERSPPCGVPDEEAPRGAGTAVTAAIVMEILRLRSACDLAPLRMTSIHALDSNAVIL